MFPFSCYVSWLQVPVHAVLTPLVARHAPGRDAERAVRRGFVIILFSKITFTYTFALAFERWVQGTAYVLQDVCVWVGGRVGGCVRACVRACVQQRINIQPVRVINM